MTRSVFASLVVLGAELSAQAPADSARRDSARAVQGVTVTESRSVGSVGGASAVTIKVGELKSSAAPLLEEALRESPFVHVRQNSRSEMELSIRGSDSRQAAVLMDGVPLRIAVRSGPLRTLVAVDSADNATTYDQCGLPKPGRTLRLMLSLQ